MSDLVEDLLVKAGAFYKYPPKDLAKQIRQQIGREIQELKDDPDIFPAFIKEEYDAAVLAMSFIQREVCQMEEE